MKNNWGRNEKELKKDWSTSDCCPRKSDYIKSLSHSIVSILIVLLFSVTLCQLKISWYGKYNIHICLISLTTYNDRWYVGEFNLTYYSTSVISFIRIYFTFNPRRTYMGKQTSNEDFNEHRYVIKFRFVISVTYRAFVRIAHSM